MEARPVVSVPMLHGQLVQGTLTCGLFWVRCTVVSEFGREIRRTKE